MFLTMLIIKNANFYNCVSYCSYKSKRLLANIKVRSRVVHNQKLQKA